MKNLILQFSLTCSLFIPGPLLAQFEFTNAQIPVTIENLELAMPWAGGLNSIQYNVLDLNFDGTNDLVLFDRSSNRLSTYLMEDGVFSYAPEFEVLFPSNLVSWIQLRDYDCDGLNDLFTDSQQGMRVFRNTSTSSLSWELIQDPVSTLGSQIINLFFNASDIASIVDLDGDGDLDVLAYNFATGENIDYHQNMSVERTGTCGLDFVRITRNYGGISECDCGDYNFNEPCPANGRILHSGGKTLLSIDLDNDGDMELLTGEETCDELTLLTNTGNKVSSSFDEFMEFNKPGTEANRIYFPGAYHIDLNNDGTKDLAVSTNLRASDNNDMDLSRTSFFYQNMGSNSFPDFELIETNFLQNQMIDIGEYAYPAFADYDRDGDQDLFVGNKGTNVHGNFKSKLQLFENTGSALEPSFSLITDDYQQLSALNLTDLKPQFVDLNSDNRLDLVLTGTADSDPSAKMLFLLNKSSSKFQFDITEIEVLSELSALSDHPTLADMNSDGTLDLLIGRTTGALELYENIGQNLSPDFQLANANFLNINISVDRINLVPFVFDIFRDGVQDLITTDRSGELSIYPDFNNSTGATRKILKNTLIEELQSTKLGRISWPVISDLYNTGSIDLAIGTIPGGIIFLRDTTLMSNLPNEGNLEIFPNPTSGGTTFIRSSINGTAQIFNISGKIVLSEISLSASQPFLLESTLYPNGVYVIRFISQSGKVTSRRLVVSN